MSGLDLELRADYRSGLKPPTLPAAIASRRFLSRARYEPGASGIGIDGWARGLARASRASAASADATSATSRLSRRADAGRLACQLLWFSMKRRTRPRSALELSSAIRAA